jgi:hypothetical protein
MYSKGLAHEVGPHVVRASQHPLPQNQEGDGKKSRSQPHPRDLNTLDLTYLSISGGEVADLSHRGHAAMPAAIQWRDLQGGHPGFGERGYPFPDVGLRADQ